MRKLYLAAFALTALGSVSASAADLAARPYTKAPISVDPSYNWSGLYIGAHVGYGWVKTDTQTFNGAGTLVDTGSGNADGVLGGGQIGFNYVFAPNWLIGIEVDISGADISNTTSGCAGGFCITAVSKIDALGTVRGRLGYFWNNVLLYGTGGAAWMQSKVDRAFTSGAPLAGQVSSPSGTDAGWTAGGGLEWGFAPNWSTKIEYLYAEIDSSRDFSYTVPAAFRHVDADTKIHTIKLGVNYRFNWGAPVVAKY